LGSASVIAGKNGAAAERSNTSFLSNAMFCYGPSIVVEPFSNKENLEKPMPSVGKAVTRVELYDAVYRNVGLSRSESSALVEVVLKEISDSVARGETVKLSSFGTFTVRQRGKRMGRNPKTGADVPISPRRVVVFKASAIMKRQINGDRSISKQSQRERSRPADKSGSALT
jgi:integration host factor subunit alpha